MQRTRRIVAAVILAARVLGLTVRLGLMYLRLRMRLGLWKTMSKIQFKRRTRSLPKGLAGELVVEYERYIDGITLPSLAGLAGGPHLELVKPFGWERRRRRGVSVA
ncbi:hypothetical protein APE_0295a [Aeropyrum pernix K1]|uniref:Uncharacterized protein n=1 Tax=Aeropyrum pernix (strain ATCC 700893 / DSM 11879 / JCM 9820 / NBRC 100138 / K1) TaxID=272557 RepID=Q05E78_AERPE|nr:hypothetical protein [Aeropyrum pernix]BAF34723.1 hypothetical protein APE_0295a [Aeropyrum pernix K1]